MAQQFNSPRINSIPWKLVYFLIFSLWNICSINNSHLHLITFRLICNRKGYTERNTRKYSIVCKYRLHMVLCRVKNYLLPPWSRFIMPRLIYARHSTTFDKFIKPRVFMGQRACLLGLAPVNLVGVPWILFERCHGLGHRYNEHVFRS